ncbi:1-deoxy-D-xylulose-5-phosphate reductoisomerase [Aquiluna sp. KACHI24]|uniref:1-deoxy-D-xylulose-5-phosphate reductoisomerase n=1 Tax=Aquiluna sp. KACHI24 TaxID=2968831 RepID=UPI00220C5F78|nr:1-deoxy-D-xylulose-5-phosphate reductoisomerase [Aquiluna sp. KACHI24]BDQ00078.1 1-deoxy-D-xylulose 5-phosphate reductoisomerase [Aquiluna sp. KACHI24]
MRKVLVLGSTGSIGTQALEVIAANPERFQLVGLSANSNKELLAEQQRFFGLTDAQVGLGPKDAAQLALNTDAAVVVNGITGSAGLEATLNTLRSGKTLALANKESLIVGGPLVKSLARPGQIVPVDSEHSAIAQCLRSGASSEVRKLILTASGGPFRGRSRQQLENVTPADALKHPTWNMGRVVTTNSATLVNKGLELIEAHLLFDIPLDRIDVTVHPQSVVHSMVEFIDGSVIAQCSPPDMKLPIALGMSWPERVANVATPVDWTKSHSWQFEPLDEEVFGAVRLAREVGLAGFTYPAVFNAANEQAVDAFHDGKLSFLGIVELVRRVVELHSAEAELSLESVLAAETWARETADSLIASGS